MASWRHETSNSFYTAGLDSATFQTEFVEIRWKCRDIPHEFFHAGNDPPQCLARGVQPPAVFECIIDHVSGKPPGMVAARIYRGVGKPRVGRFLVVFQLLALEGLCLDPTLRLHHLIHTQWSQSEGFALGGVQAIAQSADGYLWLGTAYGLYRFDGARVTRQAGFESRDFADSEIRGLSANRAGGLWVATRAGIVRIDQRSDPPDIVRSELASPVVSMLEDRDGVLWVGTLDSSAPALKVVRNGKVDAAPPPEGPRAASILSLFEDQQGRLWAGTNSGVCWMRQGQACQCIDEPRTAVIAITEDSQGLLLADANTKRLLRLRNGRLSPVVNRTFANFGATARVLLKDRDGNVWLGTLGQGLFRMKADGIERFTQKDGLSSDVVEALFEDRDGNLWVGTANGLDRFRAPRVARLSTLDGLSSDLVLSVYAADDGSVWAGTAGGGLNRIRNGAITRYLSAAGLPSTTVLALHEDRYHRLWAGTTGGLAYLSGGRFQPARSKEGEVLDRVFSITGNARLGTWLVDARKGLYQMPNDSTQPAKVRSTSTGDDVSQLACTRSGQLWIGHNSGRITVTAERSITEYGTQEGLPASPIRAIYEGDDSSIWVASSQGLSRFTQDQWTTWRPQQGIPEGGVHGIADLETGLLLLGAHGLFRIPAAEFAQAAARPPGMLQVSTVGLTDGLVLQNRGNMSNPQLTRSRDRRIWLGTETGVAVIDPAHISPLKTGPPVIIEKAFINGKAADLGSSRAPSFRGRELRIEYTAVDLSSPDAVRFRYKLAGLDTDWNEGGDRHEVVYTDLRPGDYEFQVDAYDVDRTWRSSRAAAWSFQVTPQFYQTWWFEFLCALLAGTCVWFAHYLREVSLRRRFRVVLDERLRLARDMHDTLLQGFAGVVFQLQATRRELEKDAEAGARRLEGAVKQATEALHEARETITFMHASRNENLCELVSSFGSQLAQSRSIAFEMQVTGNPARLSSDIQWNLYALLREAILNAVKHANPNRILVQLDYTPEAIRILIADDGIGFEPGSAAHNDTHIGIESMRERAKYMGVALKIESAPGKGARLSLSVAMRKRPRT